MTTLRYEPGLWKFLPGKPGSSCLAIRDRANILKGRRHDISGFDDAYSQSFHGQFDILSDGSFLQSLIFAIGRFSNLRTIHINYPESGGLGITPRLPLREQGILDEDSNFFEAALHVANELLDHVAENGVPSLQSLSLDQLTLSDLDCGDKYAGKLVHTACLQNLTSLEVVFSSCYRRGLFSHHHPDLHSENAHALLASWIQRCEKLTSLHLSFASTNTETISLNLDAPNLTQMRSSSYKPWQYLSRRFENS